jgi:phosphoglycerate dehydrogenase-like enzyme
LQEGAEDATGIFRWMAGNRFSELIGNIPSLTWLHTGSAGVDHVLTPTVRERKGMIVTDSGPAFGPAIAEYVLAVMLLHARRLPEFLTNQRDRLWQHIPQRELLGSTIGIVGLGPIGIAVAQRAKAFGMITLGLRRTDKPAEYVDRIYIGPDGLKEILPQCDYLVVAAALTGESRHLIGPDDFKMMKADALIVNIARGGLIDEQALIQSLLAGTIGGAALDVFEKEPLPKDSPLWNMPNVTITPHNSFGGTPGLRRRQIELFIENLRRYTAELPLLNVVDIDRGY